MASKDLSNGCFLCLLVVVFSVWRLIHRALSRQIAAASVRATLFASVTALTSVDAELRHQVLKHTACAGARVFAVSG